MGRIKLTAIILSIATAIALVMQIVSNSHNVIFSRAANNIPECSYHHGYHYEAVEPTINHSGHAEFWACCVCCRQYLTRPEGDFHDNAESSMIGVVDEEHIAYLPPLDEGGENGDYWVNDPFDD